VAKHQGGGPGISGTNLADVTVEFTATVSFGPCPTVQDILGRGFRSQSLKSVAGCPAGKSQSVGYSREEIGNHAMYDAGTEL